jgi:hypothetical protein
MAIQEDYLSTSVRWALFKADFPDGHIEFSDGSPQDIGIPESFSKKGERLCIATLTRFPGDQDPVVAFKSQYDAKTNDTDAWHVLCSKAMGRALKKAGYPDTMGDLKTLMQFRKANRGETETKSAEVSSTATQTVAGVSITQPVVKMESKERPARQSVDWGSDDEQKVAHDSFKVRCADLTDDERAELRSHHEKLNGKMWPMSRPDLNNLSLYLESIYASRSGAEVESVSLVDSAPLRAIFEMLSEDVKADVISAYGDPTKWPEKISEHEYEEMMDVFSFAEEE